MTRAQAGVEAMSPAVAARRADLDFMRAFVMAGLVAFHTAVVLAAGTSWFVHDARSSAGFTVFLVWGSLWGCRCCLWSRAWVSGRRNVVALISHDRGERA